MNDDDDTDVHMCLVCHSTITGLVNYINHKKNECSGRKGSKDTNPLQSQTSFSAESAVHDFSNVSYSLSSSSYLGPSYNNGSQQTFALSASGQNPGFVDSVLSTQASITNTLDDFDPVHFQSAAGDNVASLSEMFNTSIQQNMPVNQNLFDVHRTISSHHSNNGDILSSALNLSPVFSSTHHSKGTDRSDDHGILSASLNHAGPSQYNRGDYSSTDQIPIPITFPLTKSEKSPSVSNSININEIISENTRKEHDSHMKTASEKVDDFFQSLELMSKNDPRVEKGSNQPLLPISTFLNNLTFSSDEEDLGFNFADDVSLDSLSDDSDAELVPSQTGGKWKPGDQPTAVRSSRPMFRGKWPPGQAPAETRKKYYGSRQTGGKNILALKQVIQGTSGQKPGPKNRKSKAETSRTCNICQLTFENRFKYSNHCGSKQHKEKVFGKQDHIPAEFARGKGKSVKMIPDIAADRTDTVSEADIVDSHLEDLSGRKEKLDVELVAVEEELGPAAGLSQLIKCDNDVGEARTQEENSTSAIDKANADTYAENSNQAKGDSVAKAEDIAVEDENVENEVEVQDVNESKELVDQGQEDDGNDIFEAVPIFICTVCDKKFQNKYLLAHHLVTKYHRNRAAAAPLEAYQLLQQHHKYIIRFSPYQCSICRYYFNTHTYLEEHLKCDVHIDNCKELLGEIFCTLCEFKTHSQPEFEAHMSSEDHKVNVSKRKRICMVKECHVKCLCKYCGLQVQSYTRMKRHIQLKHKDGLFQEGARKRVIGQRTRPFCSKCNRTFASPSAFELHSTRFHSVGKKISCNLCNAKFAGKHALRMHEKTKKHLSNLIEAKLVKKENDEKTSQNEVDMSEGVQDDVSPDISAAQTENITANSSHEGNAKETDGVSENNIAKDENAFEDYQYEVLKIEEDSTDRITTIEDMIERKDDDAEWMPEFGKRRKRIKKTSTAAVLSKKRGKKKMPKTEPKVPNSKIFKCDHCSFTVPVYNDLRPHYLREHSGQIKLCELCDLVFLSDKALKLHVLSKEHQENISRSESTTGGGSQLFECHVCKKKFTDEKYCKFHTAYKHFHFSTEEEVLAHGNGFDVTRDRYRDVLAEAEKLGTTGSISCPECGNSLKRNSFLEHLRIHSGDKPFKCKMCPKEFASNVTLRRHLLGHFGCLECTCEVCGKEFKKISSYEEHMKVHLAEKSDQEKQHTCDTCGQSFYFEAQLQKHLRRHKAREFACTVPGCHWKFVFRNELKHHMLSHEKSRPFLCDICGYAAATKYRLRRHHRTHTGERKYHCEYCTYKAGNSTHLHRHMRIHIGSKPFKCPYCDYSCNTHENIRKHILLTKKHKGKSIYPCKFCEFGTNSSSDYRNHVLENHGSELGTDFRFDALSRFTGLYDKGLDPKKPEEGARIISVKERNISADTNKDEGTAKNDKKGKRSKSDISKRSGFVEQEHSYKLQNPTSSRRHSDLIHSMTKSPKSMAAMTLMNLAATVPGPSPDQGITQDSSGSDTVQDLGDSHMPVLRRSPQHSTLKSNTADQLKDTNTYTNLSAADLSLPRQSSSTSLAYAHLTPQVESLLKPGLFTPGSHFSTSLYAGYKTAGMLDDREPRRYEELDEQPGASFLGQPSARVGHSVMSFHNYSDQQLQQRETEGSDPRDPLSFRNSMQTPR